MAIAISIDMNRVIEKYSELTLLSDQLPGAMEAAMNDTLQEAERISEQEVHSIVNTTQKEIQQRVDRSKVRRTSRLVVSGSVFVRRKAIQLKYLDATQNGRGVSYRPFRSGTTQQIDGAFGPNIPRLGRHVFRRQGRSRLPIERVPGFSLSGQRRVSSAMRSAMRKAESRLAMFIDKHVKNALDASTSGRTAYAMVHVYRPPVKVFGVFGFGTKQAAAGKVRGRR